MLHIHVAESSVKPVIVKYKGVPSIYMRREGFTNGAILFADDQLPALIFLPVENGTPHDEKGLYQPHKASEIAEYLGISNSTYFRKKILDNLEKKGYLLKNRKSRTYFYRMNSEMVKVE